MSKKPGAVQKKEAQRWCRVVHPFTSGDGRGHVALLLCLVFLAVLLRTAWLSDDALITLRTVLNFTHGYGLTFNVAERVQTYTHPLWMLMLTGAYLVAGNVYYAAIGLSVGVSLVVCRLAAIGVVVYRRARVRETAGADEVVVVPQWPPWATQTCGHSA